MLPYSFLLLVICGRDVFCLYLNIYANWLHHLPRRQSLILPDKYGDIFVSPGGRAWAVQQKGDRLINITVKLNPTDVVKKPAIERIKHAQTMRCYRKDEGFNHTEA